MGLKADAMLAALDVSSQDNLLLDTQDDETNLVTLNSNRTNEKAQILSGDSKKTSPLGTQQTERVDQMREHYV